VKSDDEKIEKKGCDLVKAKKIYIYIKKIIIIK